MSTPAARPLRPGRWRRPVAVVLLALALAGCSVLDAPISAPLREYPAPAGVPVATQTNVSPYPELSRLGRWNGTTFAPVAAASIPAGPVVVLTHGWAAGLLSTYEAAQTGSATLVTMWDPAMVVPATGRPAVELFAGLAGDLATAMPTASILMYSWVDQSSTDMSALAAFAPERATEVNGNRMAVAIQQALTPTFVTGGGRLHLIGHSFGANVATTAAIALSAILPDAPRQLSLFDSPEVELARIGGAKNDLRYKLVKLDIGRTPGTTFVDNYVSLVGEPYNGYPGLEQVVDVRLEPPSSDTGVEKHGFPIGWYGASAGDPTSDVGLWWSPLVGADVTALASSWRQQSSDPSTQLLLRADGPVPSPSDRSSLATTTTSLDATLAVDASTSVASATITTTRDSLWLDVDAMVSGAPTDTFDLFIDGRQRAVMIAPPTPATGAPVGRFVILYDLEPGTHTVSLTRSATASPTASARLDGLTIVSTTGIERSNTPGQTTRLIVWALVVVLVVVVAVLLALVLLVRWVLRRRHHRHAGGGQR